MSAPVMVEAVSLSAGYDGLEAIRNVSMTVRAGELVALMGPNGAGKTTTLLAIVGRLRTTAGTVRLFGQEAHGPLHRRARDGLGYLAEERSFLRQMTVADNITLSGVSRDECLSIAPELQALLKRKAGHLSGGEQQILALAMVLASHPTVVVADELSLGLAPKVADRMLRALRDAADLGVAVLLVEQQAERALEFADHGYVMSRGSVEITGTADELRARKSDIGDAYFNRRTS